MTDRVYTHASAHQAHAPHYNTSCRYTDKTSVIQIHRYIYNGMGNMDADSVELDDEVGGGCVDVRTDSCATQQTMCQRILDYSEGVADTTCSGYGPLQLLITLRQWYQWVRTRGSNIRHIIRRWVGAGAPVQMACQRWVPVPSRYPFSGRFPRCAIPIYTGTFPVCSYGSRG